MVKVTFFIFLFFQVFISNSQNNKILKGEFTGNNLEKSYINVINVNQNKATISQLDGKFKIEAKVGDSILISSIQHLEIKFIVKPEFFDKGVKIPLKLKVTNLEQVDLYSIGLSGNLETYAKNIELKKPVIANFGNFDISNAYDQGVTTQSEFTYRNVAMEQNFIPTNIDFRKVKNLITGLFKKEKTKSSNTLDQKQNEINIFLQDPDFFARYLDISADNLSEFIKYAKANGLNNNKLKGINELDLIQFLEELSIKFKLENETQKK